MHMFIRLILKFYNFLFSLFLEYVFANKSQNISHYINELLIRLLYYHIILINY